MSIRITKIERIESNSAGEITLKRIEINLVTLSVKRIGQPKIIVSLSDEEMITLRKAVNQYFGY